MPITVILRGAMGAPEVRGRLRPLSIVGPTRGDVPQERPSSTVSVTKLTWPVHIAIRDRDTKLGLLNGS
ncbi:hypothetical protein GCM10010215_24440 [Streptomyces virginiae]|uniref:Uncharacterized protein n=1 Tax=Streptomyces virginiae TaxID=1961 RepID=A0ABQ3NWM5_STRVG|nr:hypothetical protein GCM10010215_24440 [Streptomyces virginiae]GHI17185.1 hypothetical protein Scinn_66480 [Streptomyces virginiae]GLV89880.1 hypothetical protein Slala04_13340 [Streptomyces lavendulae subsp. lavendulae]